MTYEVRAGDGVETKNLLTVLGGYVDAVGVATAIWTANEIFLTLFIWRSPLTDDVPPEFQEISSMVGLSQARHEARRHRNIELAILGAIGALQTVLLMPVGTQSVVHWLGHMLCFASLMLVNRTRRKAFRGLRGAEDRARQLIDQALLLKANNLAGEGEP
jgi:hypothetical protein